MSTPHDDHHTSSRPNNLWRLIAQREISTRIRDKAFLGGTLFSVVLIIGVFVVSAIVSGGPRSYDVAVIEEPPGVLDAAVQTLSIGEDEPAEIDTVQVDSVEDAEAAVLDGDADLALLPTADGYEIASEDGTDSQLASALRAAIAETAYASNAEAAGVDLAELAAGAAVEHRALDPDSSDAGARSAVAFGFAIVFLLTAMSFGMAISQSVVREKESRVVEILAAAVPIRALLWGKIVGNTVLALGQVVILVAVSLAGLALTGYDELLTGLSGAMAWYVVLFILGFVSLAALWSVAGSLASKQEDLQSTTLPGQMLLFVPYFVSVLAGESVRTVFSMLPIVSTMVMPGRIAEGDVPLWQIAVAIASTVVAAVVFVRLGERMFERTVLRTGGKLGYRQALAIRD